MDGRWLTHRSVWPLREIDSWLGRLTNPGIHLQINKRGFSPIRGAIAVLALTAVSILALVLDNPVWRTNDTSTITSFARGAYTGQPESELIVSGRFLGQVASLLYRLVPDVDWFPTLLLLVSAAALALFAGCISAGHRVFALALVLVVFMQYSLVIIVDITATSVVVAVASICVLWMLNATRFLPLLTALLVLMLAIASQIRTNGALLGVALAIPALLLLMKSLDGKLSKVFLILATLSVATPFLMSAANSSCLLRENCAAWQEQQAWYSARGSLSGNPNSQYFSNAEVVLQFGQPTLDMFQGWLLLDDQPRIEQLPLWILERYPTLYTLKGTSVIDHVRTALGAGGNSELLWASGLILLSSLIAWKTLPSSSRWYVVAVPTYGVLLVSGIALTRSTAGIVHGLAIGVALLLIVPASRGIPAPAVGFGSDPRSYVGARLPGVLVAAIAVAALLGGSLGPAGIPDRNQAGRDSASKRDAIERLNLQAALLSPILSEFQWCPPHQTNCSELPLLSPGWQTRSPHYAKRKERLGFGADTISHLLLSGAGETTGPVVFVGSDNLSNTLAEFTTEMTYHGRSLPLRLQRLPDFPGSSVFALCWEDRPCPLVLTYEGS